MLPDAIILTHTHLSTASLDSITSLCFGNREAAGYARCSKRMRPARARRRNCQQARTYLIHAHCRVASSLRRYDLHLVNAFTPLLLFYLSSLVLLSAFRFSSLGERPSAHAYDLFLSILKTCNDCSSFAKPKPNHVLLK